MEKFSVKKPFTVLVGVVMVLLLGFVALSHMQTNLLPDISTPYLMVVTVYPGASPERVESEVSDVMENALGTVAGVDTITATSAENYSLLLMKFSEGTDMNSTMVKVSNKVDQTVSSLPSSCLTPSIIEYSMNMNAFMTVAISREGSDVYDLSDFVSSTLVPYVERKGGVSSVSANGLIEKMVQVQLSQSKIDVINEKLLETIDVQLAAAHEQLEAAQAQIEAGRKEYEKQLKNYGDMVSDTVMAQMGTEVGAAVTTVRDKAQALLDSVNQLIAVVNEPEIQQALIEVRDGLQHVVDQFNETGMRDIDALISIIGELRDITDKLTVALQQLQNRLNLETGADGSTAEDLAGNLEVQQSMSTIYKTLEDTIKAMDNVPELMNTFSQALGSYSSQQLSAYMKFTEAREMLNNYQTQYDEANAQYEAAKNAEAEARRAYLAAHSAASASGEGAALDAMTEELARKKSALDAAARRAAGAEAAANKVTALLQSLGRGGFAIEKTLWPEALRAETLSGLTDALSGVEKPLEEQYFAARQAVADLLREQGAKRAELDAVSGGKWVYPHGDAATRVRDAVNAELQSRGMTPDAKIFCELLAVEDESWQDCVEACLGDRRFDILVPPAHYAAAKSAFVALKDKVGPISLLDTPGIRKANRRTDKIAPDSLAAQVTSENPLAAQYAETILGRIVCCDTPDTLEQYPDSATRDLLRHHPFRLERLRAPQRYIGLDARRTRAEALTAELEALAERRRTAEQTEKTLKAAYDQYQNALRGKTLEELGALWDSRAALTAARQAYTAQEQQLADCRENPMLQQLYKEEEAREKAWDAARAAVEQVGGDIRVCQKQLASCEAERKKAVETAQTSADAANAFFAKYPLLEPLARERWAALSGPDKAKPDRAVAQAAEKAQTKLDEALQLYLTGTLEPAQKAYNERYVCDYPLGLAGVEQYRTQYESLVRIDLERYAARLEQAQKDCKDRFRKDILFRMKDDIFNARRQFRELNKVMEQLTYGEEVYRFELEPSRDPQLAAFYQVIVDKGNQQMTDSDSLDNIAATADPVYERQVDELMEKIMADVDENTRARQEGRRPEGVTLSDYVDYRTYLDYDIKVTNTVSGQQADLSRVSRDSSGGENQAPFYVAICASLLQIYQKSENSIRLVLLDEAFSKMTSDRIRPMMELFRRLQLQVLLISTVEKSTAIQPYCDITYSIVRHGDANAIAPFYRLMPPAPEAEEAQKEHEDE